MTLKNVVVESIQIHTNTKVVSSVPLE
jgi:hypothetical protein